MKILVINPPFLPDFCRTQRWAARTRARVMRPPDWLAYATAVLEKEGYDVKLYDFPAEGWDKEDLRRVIVGEKPDIVVFDSTTPSIKSDIECAKICKGNSSAKIIMVGPHTTQFPEEALESGFVDIVARGEYDYVVRDIIRAIYDDSGVSATFRLRNNLSKVKGISYIKNGRIVHNEPQELIDNLDELPFPAWHHLNIKNYFDAVKLYPFIDIIGSRGCPHRCIFCLWPQVMHGRKPRLRSAKNIVDEMEYDLNRCNSLRHGEIFFEDDTFTINKKHVREVCNEIIKRNLKITWSANARPDITDYDLLKLMKKAGLRMLLVGFESGNEGMLKRMKKGTDLRTMVNFAYLAKRAGIKVHGCFVLGLPGETKETIEQTIEFATSVPMDTVQFSAAVPFPGTEFYELSREKGWLISDSWEDWLEEGEQSAVINYPNLPSKYIKNSVDRALRRFYFRPIWMTRFLLETKSLSDAYRKFRGARNFLSYLFRNGKHKP